MELQSGLYTRRSIRRYTDQPIPTEVLEQLVEVARFAPSWANVRPVRYICVVDPVLKAKLATQSDPYNAKYINGASALFVVVGQRNRSGIDRGGSDGAYYHTSKEWLMLDAGISIQTLCLAAWNQGLGTVILGSYDGEALRDSLQLSDDLELIALIPMGYPDESPKAPKRREVADILTIL